MMTKSCAECFTPFQYEPPKNYPDHRKYCDPCGVKKRAEHEAAKQGGGIPIQQVVDGIAKAVKAENGEYQSTVWNHAVAANSYEVGRVGNRFKLYFETVEELQAKIKELKDAGLFEEEIETQRIV